MLEVIANDLLLEGFMYTSILEIFIPFPYIYALVHNGSPSWSGPVSTALFNIEPAYNGISM